MKTLAQSLLMRENCSGIKENSVGATFKLLCKSLTLRAMWIFFQSIGSSTYRPQSESKVTYSLLVALLKSIPAAGRAETDIDAV